MFSVYTEVKAQDDRIKPRLIFSVYLCLRLTSPNYAFIYEVPLLQYPKSQINTEIY